MLFFFTFLRYQLFTLLYLLVSICFILSYFLIILLDHLSRKSMKSTLQSPYDGIGRHARLKTLSFLGPGSSPGVGKTLHTVFIQF